MSSSSIIKYIKFNSYTKLCYCCSNYSKIEGFANPSPEIEGFNPIPRTLLTPPLLTHIIIPIHIPMWAVDGKALAF